MASEAEAAERAAHWAEARAQGRGLAYAQQSLALGRALAYQYSTGDDSRFFSYADDVYRYFDNLESVVGALEALLPDPPAWLSRCAEARANGASVRTVAQLQLELSGALELRSDVEEVVAHWRHTMQMIAQGRLHMHGDRFADTLLELVSFCDPQRVGQYDAETE